MRWALRVESLRVARWERAALRRAQQVVAISAEDRERLIQLAGPAHPPVDWIAPAMPTTQKAGTPLGGDPALVLFGGSSWGPNRDGAQQFLERSWPAIRSRQPSCLLHVFGGDPTVAALPGVQHHGAPFATRSAFAEGALVLVPVRSASGVRMKILDAWSRGLAAVTTETGAMGLGARGREILRPVPRLEDLHHAVLRLTDPKLAEVQVQEGRLWLREHTDPAGVGSSFLALYQSLRSRVLEGASRVEGSRVLPTDPPPSIGC